MESSLPISAGHCRCHLSLELQTSTEVKVEWCCVAHWQTGAVGGHGAQKSRGHKNVGRTEGKDYWKTQQKAGRRAWGRGGGGRGWKMLPDCVEANIHRGRL